MRIPANAAQKEGFAKILDSLSAGGIALIVWRSFDFFDFGPLHKIYCCAIILLMLVSSYWLRKES